MSKRNIVRKVLLVSSILFFIIGTVLVVFVMYAAYDHYSQYAYHDNNGHINWGYWILVGISWAFFPYIISSILFIIRLVAGRRKRLGLFLKLPITTSISYVGIPPWSSVNFL